MTNPSSVEFGQAYPSPESKEKSSDPFNSIRCVKTERLSNQKKKGSGNAKCGNKYLSWAYSEAAHFLIRYEPRVKRYYERKRQRTNGRIAIRATAHKIARAFYYVLRDEVPFDVNKAFP